MIDICRPAFRKTVVNLIPLYHQNLTERDVIFTLQVKEISKQYVTGGLVQKALDKVSLSLRDNEFVAILGPSGSGKTTLLNIIGGLDQCDSGDLVINGISTKRYTDRDWDSYRNHTIGFVFQSYNLIPHQTVLANVELALTISGLPKRERRRKAEEALRKVGLGEQLHKRPSQMSGGQMQRVAIARALVNDPDILLADEPTGALDSDTSVQVMELLKEVARDRLVVMVTHNPELAEQYATRIITLRDGKIQKDTMPFDVDTEKLPEPVHKNMGKASMSFFTALSLSFNNLRTKLARTLLTAFAGSIGIIGIAAILSLSTGVDEYIKSMEVETLAEYPLTIGKTGFRLGGMMDSNRSTEEPEEGEIPVLPMLNSMFSTMGTNDLRSLKAFLDSGESGVAPYASAIEYSYNLEPQIFLEYGDSLRQVNPDQTSAAMGFGMSGTNSLLSSMMNSNVFFQMPESDSLYKTQYDVKAGRWPEDYHECVVVLTPGGGMSDFLLYSLGLRDPLELDELIRQFMKEEYTSVDQELSPYSYDDVLGCTFKLIDAADLYVYDEAYGTVLDKTEDEEYMKKAAADGETLTVVGIVQLSPTANGAALSPGVNYPASLIRHLVETAENQELVKRQLKEEAVDVFTGEPFGEELDRSSLDMSSLFTVDESALSGAFQFDSGALEEEMAGAFDPSSAFDLSGLGGSTADLSGMLDLSQLSLDLPGLDQLDLEALFQGLEVNVSPEGMQKMTQALLDGYQAYAAARPEADYSRLGEYFLDYLNSDAAREILRADIQAIIDANEAVTVSSEQLTALVTGLMTRFQQYVANMGYTDSDRFFEYFWEYLQTPEAQAYLDQWSRENISPEDVVILQEQLTAISNHLIAGYQEYAQNNALPDPSRMGEFFADYLATDAARAILMEGLGDLLDSEALFAELSKRLEGQLTKVFGQVEDSLTKTLETQVGGLMQQIMGQLATGLQSSMSGAFSDLGDTMQDAFHIDSDAFAQAFHMNMNGDELAELMSSMSAADNATFEGNLKKLGYVDFDDPSGISIYPLDFESKSRIVGILDGYNARMEQEDPDRVVSYTDMVGTLMSSVTDIVDVVSYVLIAFVAISLVVSSIMIGVITYISVLERKKEIGILRAIGASKRNISQVFNAETIIIGFCSGVIGITCTLLLLIPVNALIHHLADTQSINAVLPWGGAMILIALSVLLTLIGGLIPAGKASRSDPVAALRTE